MPRLKPCPACGWDEPRISGCSTFHISGQRSSDLVYIVCGNPACSFKCGDFSSKDRAIEAWNLRPLEEDQEYCVSFSDIVPPGQVYEIWSEGFRATGDSSPAHFWGKMRAPSFKEACIKFAEINKAFAKSFDPIGMDHWGCRLFDNESDARKAFG